jgi:hypothetical protein
MPKCQQDYSEIIIYKICCKDSNIKDMYIGHTTNFIQRKNQHKTRCNNKINNSKIYQFIRDNGDWENWSMIQIEKYNCKDRREAESRERYWIENLNATLNTNNPYGMCKEDPVKYKHEWYEENKDKILEKGEKKYEENKDQKLEYQKEYQEKNKEQIQLYQKEYQEKNKEEILEQKKIYREANKEYAAIKQKEWREKNKEKLKEKQSQIITCECGNQYTFGNKSRHLESKIHLAFLNPPIVIEIDEQTIMEQEEAKKQKLKQQRKLYREKNTEKIAECKKKYNDSHTEKNKEQGKKYYEEHKEQIIKQNKKYAEENKEKIKLNKELWYQQNKEIILEKNKELITCECGSIIQRSGKNEHFSSKKHQDFITII